MAIHFGYSAKIVNVETAFLYGDLEEEMYMECPQGMSNVGKDDCIIFKALFKEQGNMAVKILKNLGFVGSNVDPCLYNKKSMKGVVFVALYVDNNLIVENVKAIDDAILDLKNNGLVFKVMEGLQDYLSCEIIFSEDKKRAWLRQPHLIENMEKNWQACAGCLESKNSRYA